MEYIIYTDESVQQGRFHSNFYGGALVKSADLDTVKSILETEKQRLGLQEVKWNKVSAAYLEKYIAMTNLFFDLIESGKIKVRIMFTQNAHSAVVLPANRKRNHIFLYYHF